jgi:hypothetical protein
LKPENLIQKIKMKVLLFFSLFLIESQLIKAQSNWVKRAGGATTDLANSLWTDNYRNIFVTGSISGKAKFHKTEVTSRGGGDVYVTKYSPEGIPIWVKTFGGVLDDFANSITGDPEGNLYVTGIFTNSAQFGDFTLEAKGTDLFVAKLNSKGQVVWVSQLNTAGTALVQSISVTDQGGVYVGGLFSGQYSETVKRKMGQTDGFITKLSWQGEVSWTKVFGGSGFDEVNILSTDPWGRVVAGGVFDQVMYVEDQEIVGNSSKSAFAVRLEATGNILWAKGFSGFDAQTQIMDAATDLDGTVYLTGKFSGENFFGTNVKVSKGQSDIFLMAIKPKGDINWVSEIGGSEVDEPLSIQLTPDQKSILVSGTFNKFLEHGRKSILGEYDNQLFLSRWDLRGNLDELRKQDFNSLFNCAGKRLDGKGNIWICGSFSNKTSFGKQNFVSAGEEDLFISAIADPKGAK